MRLFSSVPLHSYVCCCMFARAALSPAAAVTCYMWPLSHVVRILLREPQAVWRADALRTEDEYSVAR
uniref:Putative secreted peptide n=1 Tax=Anopheles braziliensis TaxID=58242 RepID=A0A2M3ZXK5_9DIPT